MPAGAGSAVQKVIPCGRPPRGGGDQWQGRSYSIAPAFLPRGIGAGCAAAPLGSVSALPIVLFPRPPAAAARRRLALLPGRPKPKAHNVRARVDRPAAAPCDRLWLRFCAVYAHPCGHGRTLRALAVARKPRKPVPADRTNDSVFPNRLIPAPRWHARCTLLSCSPCQLPLCLYLHSPPLRPLPSRKSWRGTKSRMPTPALRPWTSWRRTLRG